MQKLKDISNYTSRSNASQTDATNPDSVPTYLRSDSEHEQSGGSDAG